MQCATLVTRAVDTTTEQAILHSAQLLAGREASDRMSLFARRTAAPLITFYAPFLSKTVSNFPLR